MPSTRIDELLAERKAHRAESKRIARELKEATEAAREEETLARARVINAWVSGGGDPAELALNWLDANDAESVMWAARRRRDESVVEQIREALTHLGYEIRERQHPRRPETMFDLRRVVAQDHGGTTKNVGGTVRPGEDL